MKNFFKILSLCIPVALIVYTCYDRETDKELPEPEEPQSLTINDAKSWYEETQPGVLLFGQKDTSKLKSAGSDRRIVNTTYWEKAKVMRNKLFSVVEVPIYSNHSRFMVHGGMLRDDIENYPGIIRLVVRRNLETGDTDAFVWTFTGDSAYVAQPGFRKNLYRNRFLKRQNDFNGTEVISSPEGDFLRGYIIEGGKRIKRFEVASGDSAQIARKASYICDYEEIRDYEWYCYSEYDDYEDPEIPDLLPGSSIVCEKVWYVRHEPVYCEEENNYPPGCYDDCSCYGYDCGGGDSGGGDPNPPTPLQYYTVRVYASMGGTVSGGGTVLRDAMMTISAAPNPGYTFISWSGSDYAYSATHTFMVTENMNFTAYFADLNTSCPSHADQISTSNQINNILSNVHNLGSNYAIVRDYIDQLRIYASTSSIEWGLAIDDLDGDIYVCNKGNMTNPIYWNSGASNGVKISNSQYTILLAHSHPLGQNPAPSPSDAVALAKIYAGGNSDIKANVVFAHDGSEYMVYVASETSLISFCSSGNNSFFIETTDGKFSPGSKFDQEYTAAYNSLKSTLSDNDAQLYALSYVLDKNYTGLKICQKNSGTTDFVAQRTEYTNNQYLPVICP